MVGKGGTAKTTSTACLGDALARRGKRTLIVDLDVQASLSDWLLPDRDEGSMVEDVLLGRSSWADAVVALPSGLLLAPSRPYGLSEVERVISEKKRQRELVLAQSMKDLAAPDFPGGPVDVVVLDTPRGLDTVLNLNVFEAMTRTLALVEPTAMSLNAFEEIIGAVRETERERGVEVFTGILPTRFTSTIMSKSAIESIEALNLPILTTIRSTIRAAECVAMHMTLHEYDPTCTAALDYESLGDEILALLEGAR